MCSAARLAHPASGGRVVSLKSMIYVYILYSEKLKKYYAGSTNNVESRLLKHNSSNSGFTSAGKPWNLVTTFECANRSEALKLESKIKKRGIRRFLEDINHGV